MSTTTPKLGLFKYDTTTDGKETFSINQALNNNWDIIDNMDLLPDQTGKNGYILTTNGSEASWGETGEIYPIIETYINEGSWYRVYSDGWCEQGQIGITTKSVPVSVTFLKPFTSLCFCKKVRYGVVSTGDNLSYGEFLSLTTLGFTTNQDNNCGTFGWYACGYVEV